MLDRLTLRHRVAIFFALMALSVPVFLGGGLYLIAERINDNPVPAIVLYGGGAGFVIVSVIVWTWAKFDGDLVAPIQALTRDLQTLTHANPGHEITLESEGYVHFLTEAAQETAEALKQARANVAAEVEAAVQASHDQRQRLEAVLHDLREGVIVCNLDHRILLYNQRAMEILHVAGQLGLDRPLFSVMNRQPFLHAVERLSYRLAAQQHLTHEHGLSTLVVCSTADGRYTLEGRVGLILGDDGVTPTGYVVTFDDVTAELATLGQRDRLLRAAVDGLRRPVANLRAATETLTSNPHLDEDGRRAFEGVLSTECEALSRHLEQLGQEYHELITGNWPMSDVYSANLINCLVRRFREEGSHDIVMTGIPVWLHCDSHTVVELLDLVLRRTADRTGVTSFDLEATSGPKRIYIDVRWQGEIIPSSVLDAWLDEAPDERLGMLTARDVLEHHDSEVWSETVDASTARIRLPLPPAVKSSHQARGLPRELPSRPEFYDFELLKPNSTAAQAIADRRLRDLTFVVFDTETTGLSPSNGDEIISIAGVRILNGRILTGEAFSELVNPGREIPKPSIKFHGISNDMVKDKLPISHVLPQFHAYVGDAVLVAHNAAFDMKFLHLKQNAAGVRFDSPVLDTVLLSAFVHDHTGQHTLDAVAERFGVQIQGRHTALGDALVTAAVFLRMIDLLEAQDIQTLAQALEVSNRMVEIRKQQARY